MSEPPEFCRVADPGKGPGPPSSSLWPCAFTVLGVLAVVRGSFTVGGVLCACFDQHFLPRPSSPATEFSPAGATAPAPLSSSLWPCAFTVLGVLAVFARKLSEGKRSGSAVWGW